LREVKPGDRISEYVLDREVGRGGFGTVFRATHHALTGRVVAVKVALDAERGALLRHEGVLQDVVRHPHAVEVLGLDADHDPPYLVMEFIEGESLRERLARDGRLSVPEALRIGEEVLEALACAHARGILHLDLKPANVLLDRIGNAKLTDFGLGRARESERADLLVSGQLLSRTDGDLVGTLPYMAPEQKVPGREVDARADVYAFGILLFEMLTGARPEGGEVPSDRVPGLDVRIDAVFRRCYCPVERRFADGSAVLAAVQPLLRGSAAPVVASSPDGQVARLERVHSDGREPELVPLGVRPISVGSHAGAGLRVRAPWVSWWHAEIAHKDGAWWVRDLESSSGTFLLPAAAPGGSSRLDHLERVGREPQRLAEGVELCLGDPRTEGSTRFRYRDGEPFPGRVVIGSAAADARRWSAMGQGATWFGVLLLSMGTFCVLRLGRIFLSIVLLGLGVLSLLVASFLEPRAEHTAQSDGPAGDGGGWGPLAPVATRVGPVGSAPAAGPTLRGIALVFDLGVVALCVRLLAGEALGAIPVVWLLYEGLTTGFLGATPGKWLCGLEVVDRRGERIGMLRSIVRAFAKILSSAVLGLGYLPAFLTFDARTAHDMAAETRVVQAAPLARR